EPSMHGPSTENPEDDPGGKRRAVFRGYTGSTPLGWSLKASQRMTLVCRAPAAHRPIPSPVGRERDDDACRYDSLASRTSRPGGSSEAIRDEFSARSISSSSPRSSALRSALDQDRSPSRPVDETFGIPFANPADIPPGHHPEGSQFQVSGPA